MRLFIQAYLELIRFEFLLRRGRFQTLREVVAQQPTCKKEPRTSSQAICRSVDLACLWYWKEVLCLQRSAATTCLLRKYGFPAQLIIGVQTIPFKSHAWVELGGEILNDKPYSREMYALLDRC